MNIVQIFTSKTKTKPKKKKRKKKTPPSLKKKKQNKNKTKQNKNKKKKTQKKTAGHLETNGSGRHIEDSRPEWCISTIYHA